MFDHVMMDFVRTSLHLGSRTVGLSGLIAVGCHLGKESFVELRNHTNRWAELCTFRRVTYYWKIFEHLLLVVSS